MSALQRADWLTGRTTFGAGVVNQNRFTIRGDFVVGDYGNTCDSVDSVQGAIRECDHGGRLTCVVAPVEDELRTTAVRDAPDRPPCDADIDRDDG